MKHSAKGNLFLLLAALIWGCGLVAQKAGMFYLGPFGYTGIRCTLGGLMLLPVIFLLERQKAPEERQETAETMPELSGEADVEKKESRREIRRRTMKGAVCCGIALTGLILFQQYGLPHTTVGKAGFITALYILITPVMGMCLGKKAGRNLWIGVVVGLAGMYMLCLFEDFSGITYGDFMMLGAACMAALHIHVVDHFVRTVDPVKLSAYQFIVTGMICLVGMLLFETVTWEAVKDCAVPILYGGLASCGLGYTLQIIGQKLTDPNLASLLLSLETVFCLLAGWVFFHEVLSVPEYIGCALMMAAIIISQLPEQRKSSI